MERPCLELVKGVLVLLIGLTPACWRSVTPPSIADSDNEDSGDTATHSDVETDTITSDSDTETGAIDTDSSADAGPDYLIDDAGVITFNCAGCSATGQTVDELRCAIDLCEESVFLGQEYSSPTAGESVADTFAAVSRFGSADNHLAPRLNGSYALMATGYAEGLEHNTELNSTSATGDPFSSDGHAVYDVMEWRLQLKAPKDAKGFRIYYIFFSEEYDEYVGSSYNDKFYIFIEAPSTEGGLRSVINFTKCRDPDTYFDFTCTDENANCTVGERYCYIAVNTALSECCWYNGCQSGTWTTDLSGTGFSCAPDAGLDQKDEAGGLGSKYGSSTGWLVTEWPITAGEEFNIIFHIHDTADARLDSEVIIDSFQFIVEPPTPGTGPV